MERAGNGRSDRGREQDPSFAPFDHVTDDVLGQLHRRADVQVDDLQLLTEVGIGRERAAGADSGVQGSRVQRSRGRPHETVQSLHALFGPEVDPQGVDVRAGGLQITGRGRQLGVFGGDDQVKSVVGELLGKLKAGQALPATLSPFMLRFRLNPRSS